MSKEIKLNEQRQGPTNKLTKWKPQKKAQSRGRAEWMMNKQTKERKEWKKERRAVRRDGGNEDELMSCWQPSSHSAGRWQREGATGKKHKDEWLLCRLLIWLCSKFASESPHMRGARENERESRAMQIEERGAREGRAIFWALTEQALPSPHPIPPSRFPPFPENSLYHTHWTNYKHCLAAKSWGPRRVTARMGLNARSPEPQHRRAGERPFLSVCFCKARTDGADSV